MNIYRGLTSTGIPTDLYPLIQSFVSRIPPFLPQTGPPKNRLNTKEGSFMLSVLPAVSVHAEDLKFLPPRHTCKVVVVYREYSPSYMEPMRDPRDQRIVGILRGNVFTRIAPHRPFPSTVKQVVDMVEKGDVETGMFALYRVLRFPYRWAEMETVLEIRGILKRAEANLDSPSVACDMINIASWFPENTTVFDRIVEMVLEKHGVREEYFWTLLSQPKNLGMLGKALEETTDWKTVEHILPWIRTRGSTIWCSRFIPVHRGFVSCMRRGPTIVKIRGVSMYMSWMEGLSASEWRDHHLPWLRRTGLFELVLEQKERYKTFKNLEQMVVGLQLRRGAEEPFGMDIIEMMMTSA